MISLRAKLGLTIVALGILLLGLTPYPRAFVTALRRANGQQAAGEYAAALDGYRQASEHDPRSPLPWLQMGQILLRQHRFQRSAAAFLQAEQRGARLPALLGLGQSQAGRDDWTAAMRSWLQALALAPGDARPYLALARGSIAQGRFRQARDLLNQALARQPTRQAAAEAHALLGRLLAGEDTARAAEHLRQADEDEILAVVEAAAEADPARRAILLGATFLQRGELGLARREFERARDLAPDNAQAHAYLGHVLDRQGATVAAEEALLAALDRDPDSALAYYFLGVHHRRLGDAAGAQEALWQALLRDPENAALRVEMAEAFADQGEYALAEEWYQGAVEVAPTDPDFALLLVQFYVDHLYRVEEGAIPAAESAVALAPGNARAHDLLGWATYLAGRYAAAGAALHQALALDPDLVSAHYHLGSLYTTTGQRDLARQHLQRAADLDTTGYYRQRAGTLLANLE